jgi:hypothetical protein
LTGIPLTVCNIGLVLLDCWLGASFPLEALEPAVNRPGLVNMASKVLWNLSRACAAVVVRLVLFGGGWEGFLRGRCWASLGLWGFGRWSVQLTPVEIERPDGGRVLRGELLLQLLLLFGACDRSGVGRFEVLSGSVKLRQSLE